MGIDLQNVSRKFGSNRPALHQISFSVPSGQIVGLIGPSGAGKSTLLRCISGLCIAEPGSGAVYLFTGDAGVWTETAYLKASNADAGDRFGNSLAFDAKGELLIVGAPLEDRLAAGVTPPSSGSRN